MAVDLILLEDVAGLGELGDPVRVAEGYARNFLLPRKLAQPVTPAALRMLEAKKLRLQAEHEDRLTVARALADKISRISVTIPVQAAENDKLYGSVTPIQILEVLAREGFELERHVVNMPEPIRELGVYTVEIQLHDEVKAPLKVWVVRT